MSTYVAISPDPAGYAELARQAQERNLAVGQTTLVTPDGRYFTIAFEFTTEFLATKDIEPYVYVSLKHAAKKLAKAIASLTVQVSDAD